MLKNVLLTLVLTEVDIFCSFTESPSLPLSIQVYWRPENNPTNEDTFMYVANAEREMPVNNLRSGTVYFLQVAAVNRYGAGPKTAQIRVKTVYVPTTPGMQNNSSSYHINHIISYRIISIISHHINHIISYQSYRIIS